MSEPTGPRIAQPEPCDTLDMDGAELCSATFPDDRCYGCNGDGTRMVVTDEPAPDGPWVLVSDVSSSEPTRPEVVCLCGSTRFMNEFIAANKRLTLAGRIVLTVGAFGHHDPDIDMDGQVKVNLDELHKRKIDLADSILVLNVGGYIGDSTRSEIVYAKQHGKRIDYLEEP